MKDYSRCLALEWCSTIAVWPTFSGVGAIKAPSGWTWVFIAAGSAELHYMSGLYEPITKAAWEEYKEELVVDLQAEAMTNMGIMTKTQALEWCSKKFSDAAKWSTAPMFDSPHGWLWSRNDNVDIILCGPENSKITYEDILAHRAYEYSRTATPLETVDPGKHYRYTYRQHVTRGDADVGYVDVKLDPYRVCKVYKVNGGPREHIAKKALRGCSKGHTELELIGELQSCLDRWKEMIEEDES